MSGDDRSPAVPAPAMKPPLLEVGFNYPGPYNRYGTTIGPRDIEHATPLGVGQGQSVFKDVTPTAPLGVLDRNLKILRDQLKIKKVRMFLLGNAFNYGTRPTNPPPSFSRSRFVIPTTAHPLFVDHFKQMLEIFARNEVKVLPSLLDFGAFYPIDKGMGGGRTDIIFRPDDFITGMVEPLVKASLAFKDSVWMWEAVNEPVWNTIDAPFVGRPHAGNADFADCTKNEMARFIRRCLDVFEGQGFDSTVGHRFLSDLSGPMPTGTKPQFHLYGAGGARSIVNLDDPDPIPGFGNAKVKGAFIGEFGAAPGGGSVDVMGFKEPGDPWPECDGADNDRKLTCFARLKVLARKGYQFAFVWPDRNAGEPGVVAEDELKLTADAQASIKKFTTGLFVNGVP